MSTEGAGRGDKSIDSCSVLGNPAVVPPVSRNVVYETSPTTSDGQSFDTGIQQQAPLAKAKTKNDSRVHIRKCYRQSGLSKQATTIILSAWKPGTHKQYSIMEIECILCAKGSK